jgi:hypothetical protein
MDRQASVLGRLDDVDSNGLHWRSGAKWMSARLGILVFNTSLAKSTAPPDKAGSETHPFLECCGFNGFDNLQKLKLEGTM